MTAPLALLVLIGPVMLLAAAVVGLCRTGPLGWAAAAGLLVAVGWSTRWACRCCRTWWQGTRAPELAPGQRPPGSRWDDVSGGTGRDGAAPRARPAGTSRG